MLAGSKRIAKIGGMAAFVFWAVIVSFTVCLAAGPQ